MKILLYVPATLILAFGTLSCMTYTEKVYQASGYDARMSYNLGLSHGTADRLAGKAHDPHINHPHEVPASYRTEYVWGYTKGYQAHSLAISGSK